MNLKCLLIMIDYEVIDFEWVRELIMETAVFCGV
jgi:hypothetical protein